MEPVPHTTRKTLDLTSVVDIMARSHFAALMRQHGAPFPDEAFDHLDRVSQLNQRQAMLELLLPAVPVIEAQMNGEVA